MKKLLSIITIIIFVGIIGLNIQCNKPLNTETTYGWVVGTKYGGYGAIFKTISGGIAWNRQGDTTMIPNADLNGVSAVSYQTVWAVGASCVQDTGQSFGTILHTTDGGQTWVRQGSAGSIPDVYLGNVSAVNEQIAWVTGFEGIILKTSDEGNNWVQQAQGLLPNTEFMAVYAYDQNNVWAVGCDAGHTAVILHTSDGGNTWTRQGVTELQGVMGLIDVHAISANTVTVVGTDHRCLISTDSGAHWVTESVPGQGEAHINGVCMTSEEDIWMASDQDRMYFTKDAGSTWTESYTPTRGIWHNNLNVTAINKNTVWVTCPGGGTPQGQIFHTKDRGKNWTELFASDSSRIRGITIVGAFR